MAFTNRTGQALLNSLFGKTSNFGALASAPTLHVGLSTTAPTESGGNVTEPAEGGYARVATTGTDWNAATDADPSVITNAAAIDFGTASATWAAGANMTHLVIFDAATAGNLLVHGTLTDAQPVINGNPVNFPIGTLSVSLD